MVAFNDLNIGDSAKIVGYQEHNEQVAKLQSLGLVPGTLLTLVRAAPLGDPIQVNVRGYSLAISKRTAEVLRLAAP
ncbi:MAG: FeoA family protein [Gammaproteobacteria bacterium]|nr:FeoA family protein [Gammaproteobacteria bacterium]